MMWGLLTNHVEENKVNDQRHMIDQNKFQRLNIDTLKKEVIKAVEKNTKQNIGDCFYNLGGEAGFSQQDYKRSGMRR